MELVLGGYAIAVATAILPMMSHQAAAKDFESLKKTLAFSVRIVAFITVPAALRAHDSARANHSGAVPTRAVRRRIDEIDGQSVALLRDRLACAGDRKTGCACLLLHLRYENTGHRRFHLVGH